MTIALQPRQADAVPFTPSVKTDLPAVLLDKDGTLLEDVPYNVDPRQMRFAAGAAEGIVRLHDAGYILAVVSNQSGVALGRFAEAALGAVEARLRAMFAALHVPLAGFYWCPHHPNGIVKRYRRRCRCRKPAAGMLLEAIEVLQIDPARSWMAGDILHDVEAGNRAGCRTVLLDNGNETEWESGPYRIPDFVVPDLAEAARRIVHADRANPWRSLP
jgi:D-glycero-D-manno-heptose 1,7-bisphosphate phosphatase